MNIDLIVLVFSGMAVFSSLVLSERYFVNLATINESRRY